MFLERVFSFETIGLGPPIVIDSDVPDWVFSSEPI